MSGTKKVIIIGGGAVGLSCAYYLNKSGHDVTVLDRDPEGSEEGCSFGNAGMIVPSHFIPLAVPGIITQGLKWMFNPESPFGLKPSLDPELIAWALKFKKAANWKKVEIAKPILRDMNMMSRNLFEELDQNPDLDFGFGGRGLMMLYKTEKFGEEESHVAQQAGKLGIPTEILSQQEVQKKETELDVNVLGGVFYPKDAHISPNDFIKSLTVYLQDKGVKIEKGAAVEAFVKVGNKIDKVQTSNGTYEADEFVVATGAWSGKVVKELGIKMPMQGGKGYSMTVQNPSKQLQIPSILLEARVAMTPMGDRMRITGTMEIGGVDLSINQRKVDGIIKSIPNFFPDFNKSWVEGLDVWRGLRPCSPDGMPYIGRFNQYPNLLAATGHSMMGISLAPVSGKLISEIINEEKPSIDLSLMNVDRYN